MIKNEWLRKKVVYLKRNVNIIPLLFICVACMFFNLKLAHYSKAIQIVNEPGMGIALFAITLCSFLSVITFLQAFPKRSKPKYVSIGLVIGMLVLSIICQVILIYFFHYATMIKENPIIISEKTYSIVLSSNAAIVHIVLLVISIILISTLSLYKKLILKIDTSIQEESIEIGEIDLATDEE